MSKQIPACVQRYQAAFAEPYGHCGRWRQQKKFYRKQGMDHQVEIAYYAGQDQGMRKHPRPNPYPPGRRYNAYQQGLEAGRHH